MSEQYHSPDPWPLQLGDTLSNHDWWPWYGHKWLGSGQLTRMLMEGRRADLGTSVILMSEAMRQDPAGTLPSCDIELAGLARFATLADWMACRAGVLAGWSVVLVEDPETGEVVERLGHVDLRGVVQEMHKRKRGRAAGREAGNLAVRKSRIRRQMKLLKVRAHVIDDENAIEQLAGHFEHSNLFITRENVRAALIEVLGYGGEVARFPPKTRPG